MKHLKYVMLILAFFLLGSCALNGKHKDFKFSGTLELTEHSVGAKVSGRVTTLLVDEGSEVKKDQEVATLDRFEQNKKDYERLEAFFKEGGANAQEVEHAKLALDDQRIVSPVDGVVLVKVSEIGEVVSAGSPVVVIGDRSSLWVKIYVPEGMINRVSMNQPATLHFDGLDKVFKGHVSFIASKAEFTPRNVQTSEERVTQTFAIKVALDNPEPFLRPGVAADVYIQLNK